MVKLKLQSSKMDFGLLAVVFFLTAFGLVMIYDSSIVQALRDFSDKYYFVKLQLIWAAIGFAALLFFSKFNYQKLKKITIPLVISGIILLIIVIIPGVASEVYGAKRRIDIGFITIQPAEFIKLAYVLYLANFLSRLPKLDHLNSLLASLATTALIIGLVLLEPDLGTASVIVAISLIVYFAAGLSIRYFLFLGPVIAILGFLFALSAPYRINRLLSFVNPLRDPQGSSYHINQILIALANGGLFGLGLGQSRQKYEYLPEVATDSIFAIVAEELGFFGSLILLTLLLFLIYRGIKIAKNATDHFGRLLALGITSWIGIQTVVNLGSMVALFPLTGIPLPFISYGGSALVTNLAAIGILLSISKHQITSLRK